VSAQPFHRYVGFYFYTTQWYVLKKGCQCRHGCSRPNAFAMQTAKAWIGDDELREAFTEMLFGQADNLGGGVWKKRLNGNRHRSIVLAKGGGSWIYQFLYAKQDQSNISPRYLLDLRELAKTYGGLTEMEIQRLLDAKEFVEIPNE